MPDLDENFFNAITIAIEMLIRINQTLTKIFRADFDWKIFSRPYSWKVKRVCLNLDRANSCLVVKLSGFSGRLCWKIFERTLIDLLSSRPCLKKYFRTLLKIFQTRSRSRLKMWFGSTGPCLEKFCRTLVEKLSIPQIVSAKSQIIVPAKPPIGQTLSAQFTLPFTIIRTWITFQMMISTSRASSMSLSEKAFLPNVSLWNRIADVASATASSYVSPSPTMTPRIPTGYAT